MTVHRPETHYLRAARRITIAGLVESGRSRSRISDADVVRSVKSASIDESNSPDNGPLVFYNRRNFARQGCFRSTESRPAFAYSRVPTPGIPVFSGVAPASIARAA